ncbi:MAG: NHL repeat-containing protein [Planctomycetota bacterium]|jgi:hypothetical protein
MDRLHHVAVDREGNMYLACDVPDMTPLQGTQPGRVFLAKFDSGGRREWITQFGRDDEMPGGLATDSRGHVHLATWDSRSEPKQPATLYEFGNRAGDIVQSIRTDDERPVRDLATDESGEIRYYVQERVRSDMFPLASRKAEELGGSEARARYAQLPYDGILKLPAEGGFTWELPNTRRPDVHKLSIPTDAWFDGVGWTVVWDAYLPEDISVQAIAVDAVGDVYACGYRRIWPDLLDLFGTEASEGPLPSSFLARYTHNGNLDWFRWHGDHEHDLSMAVAVDGRGNAYVADITPGRTPEKPNRGLFDVRLVKYNPAGELLWMRQFGTMLYDVVFSIAVWPPVLPGVAPRDAETIYVAGVTQGDLYDETADLDSKSELSAFLVAYDPDGNRTFLEQFPLAAKVPEDLVNLRLTTFAEVKRQFDDLVQTEGMAAGAEQDTSTPWFLMRTHWWRKLPVSAVVTTDEMGNVYLAGSSEKSLDTKYRNRGNADVFLMRFAPNPEVMK